MSRDKTRKPPVYWLFLLFDSFGHAIPEVCRKLVVKNEQRLSVFESNSHCLQVYVKPEFEGQYQVFACLGSGLRVLELDCSGCISFAIEDAARYCNQLRVLKINVDDKFHQLETSKKRKIGTKKRKVGAKKRKFCSNKFEVIENKAIHIKKLLEKQVQSLEELEIRNEKIGYNCPRHSFWTNLFNRITFSRLKSLSLVGSYKWVERIVTEFFLAGLAKNLKGLKLKLEGSKSFSETRYKKLFTSIKSHCTQLSSIIIDGVNIPQGAYEKLLTSYGHQLRHVTVSMRSGNLASWRRIVQHCPNLKLRAILDNVVSYEDPNILGLAPYFSEIQICIDESPKGDARKALEYFGNQLPTLKKLTCYNLDLFEFLTHELDVLEVIWYRQGFENLDREVVDKMENSKISLKELFVDADCKRDIGLCCSLLKCCSNLKHACVRLKFDPRDSMPACCNEILFALRGCGKLESISIEVNLWQSASFKFLNKFLNDIKEPQFFGLRKVRIIICGVELFVPFKCTQSEH